MENIIIRIIISIVVILVISACSKDEEESTTITYTCTGSSSGSGPTIGGVTLEEATYKSGTKSFAFVNSTSANHVYQGQTPFCYTIDVTSTTVSMYKTNSANTGNATIAGGQAYTAYDNVTAYYTIMTGHPATYYMYIFADTDSSFYLNAWGHSSKSAADSDIYMTGSAYTKQ
jgi:hypothetical protein